VVNCKGQSGKVWVKQITTPDRSRAGAKGERACSRPASRLNRQGVVGTLVAIVSERTGAKTSHQALE
jgi:hypothetical protein